MAKVNKKVLELPIGVKIISVLYYIAAVSSIILGISFLAGASIAREALTSQIPTLVLFGPGMLIFGAVFLVVGIISFLIGRGLWKGKNWARIVAIIIAGIGIVFAIIGIVQGNIIGTLFRLVLNGVIGGYLLLNKQVKKVFL